MAVSRTEAEDNVELRVNLSEVFDVAFPPIERLKQRIGQELIDIIEQRTLSGKSRSGKPFKKYSNEYSSSLPFRAFGKSKGRVNMKLEGDMLGSMDIKSSNGDEIVLGWQDDTNNKKAFNHVTGDTVPRRDFFWITQKELDQVRSNFGDRVKEETQPVDEENGGLAPSALALAFISQLRGP